MPSIRALAAAAFAMAAPSISSAQRPPTPPINHVFIIMLENQGYDTTFGPGTRATYLADTVVAQGALLPQYYGIGHFSLDNYIAIISGVAPNLRTQQDCPRFDEFVETGVAPDGQPIGVGCVYPSHVQTIANQLAAAHRSWKGYMEDMGNDPSREKKTCGHATIGMLDSTERATPTDMYAGKHDPFVYFHSIIDDQASCGRHVVRLDELERDLRSASRTPNLSFIVPNLCHDGHDRPCRNGEPGALVSANEFLRRWVPRITKSPAFRDGLLVITFDEALSIDATGCCDEASGPNTKAPGVNGPGGGRTGAVLVSPFIAPGTVSQTPYNHYSLLKSLEDIFGLPYLGYAGQPGLVGFGTDIFTRR